MFYWLAEKRDILVKNWRILAAVLALAVQARGQTFTLIGGFNGSNGGQSFARLYQSTDGFFYGTTGWGGSSGGGTFFRISSAGSLTNLHNFTGGGDGGHASFGGALVQGSDGLLYGTTYEGGAQNTGVVFKITSAGTLTPLHQFSGPDGGGPEAGLLLASDGNFYGTTYWGGSNNFGTIFRVNSAGVFTNLYQFGNVADDGKYPYSGMVQGGDGLLYGTTFGGGSNGWGSVFKMTTAGTLTTLHHFGPYPDGADPYGITRGPDGFLYGTTSAVGPDGRGTVYKIDSLGAFQTIHGFTNGVDGGGPQCELLLASDGNLYGTTYYGGITNSSYSYGAGVVFRITTAGTLTTVYQFTGGNDGASPFAGLVQGSDGNLYGTTSLGGGTNTDGIIFRLSIPLNPPANQVSGIRGQGSDVFVTVPSVWSETYQLQYRSSLTSGNWSNIVGACASNSIGALLTVTNFGGAIGPQGFYRFDVTP